MKMKFLIILKYNSYDSFFLIYSFIIREKLNKIKIDGNIINIYNNI